MATANEARPGEIPLTEVTRRWLAKWGLHKTSVWMLVKKKGVIPYRQTPSQIYVNEKDADEYVHNFRRGVRGVYTNGTEGSNDEHE